MLRIYIYVCSWDGTGFPFLLAGCPAVLLSLFWPQVGSSWEAAVPWFPVALAEAWAEAWEVTSWQGYLS